MCVCVRFGWGLCGLVWLFGFCCLRSVSRTVFKLSAIKILLPFFFTYSSSIVIRRKSIRKKTANRNTIEKVLFSFFVPGFHIVVTFVVESGFSLVGAKP